MLYAFSRYNFNQKSFHCHCSQCCHLQPLVILLCKLYLPSLVSILPLANLPELNQYEPSQQSKRVADVRALVKTWAITQYQTVGTVYSQYNWFSFASNTMVHIVVTDDKIWLMKQILDNRRGNNHSVILFFVFFCHKRWETDSTHLIPWPLSTWYHVHI